MKLSIRKTLLAMAVSAVLAVPAAQGASSTPPGTGAESAAQAQASSPPASPQARAEAERNRIVEEAVSALAKTNEALRALDAGDTDKALEALALAVGKLELIVAMEPEATLAPVDVQMITQDLVATPEDVKKAVDKAEDLLEDGRIQQARLILRDLGSEIIVRVVNIPLGTYPDAIKAVVPLIKDGKTEAAKAALVEALSTLVIVDHVIPLPLLRAEAALDEARALAAKADRTEAEDKRLAELLKLAREELELGRALGYGEKKDYAPFFEAIAEIEKHTADKGTEEGLFDRLRKEFAKLRDKL